MIAAVVLAAGRGSRFGGAKLLARLRGRPVIRWSTELLVGAVDEIVVVIPPGDTEIRHALDALPLRFVESPGRDVGMSSSLAEGIASLPDDAGAALVSLGDQPGMSREVVSALIQRWRESGAPAVVPVYSDGRGHPVLFDRRCFADLLTIEGDVGARGVLASLGNEVALVSVPGAQPPDVDTPDALERLERSQRPGT